MTTSTTRPNVFIVGQPKSGTSALYAFLRNHPQVCVGSTKEPQYFCKDLESQYFHLSKLERTDENYLDLFSHCTTESVQMEASTAYLYSTVAAQEIHKFNPDAKIIMLLREPASFLYTYHLQLQRNSCTFEDVVDFADALSLEPERKAGNKIPARCLDPKFIYYSDRVKYAEQIQRYMDIFPSDQLKIIIHDDFKKDNESIYNDVVSFLGIDENYRPEFRSVNTQVKVRSRRLKQTSDRLIFPIKQFLKPCISGAAYKRMRNMYRMLVFRKGQVKPLDAELELTLKKRFKPEVEKLSSLLDRDLLTLWGYQDL